MEGFFPSGNKAIFIRQQEDISSAEEDSTLPLAMSFTVTSSILHLSVSDT